MDIRLLLIAFCIIYMCQVSGFLSNSESNWTSAVRSRRRPSSRAKSSRGVWMMGRHLVLDPTRICRKTRRLRVKQATICQKEPELVRAITQGVKLGITECEYQFQNRRWNCSTLRGSMKRVLKRDTRETGFLNAITAAGVTYSVTQSCTFGNLLDCSCIRNMPHPTTPQALEAKFEWGGCDENINFGYRKSREFMDDHFRKRSDIKTLLLMHNYEAGRLAISKYMRQVCKCHGMSGSCATQSCWKRLPSFRDVGHRLKERFDGSVKVMAGNDGKGFIPEDVTIKPPEEEDIVYSEDSPDYCVPNRETGSLGTHGRLCNNTSMGVDGCELLCCGRGYVNTKQYENVKCKCRFKYCCDVLCDECKQPRVVSRCK